jgi:DNA invertase Pin-like site-specific DNA recombinase
MGRFFSTIAAATAQFEVEMTAFRTKTGIAASQGRGIPYGRKVEFDLEKAKRHLRKHKNLSAAAKHVGVNRQRLWYHVQNDPVLMKFLKIKD